MKKLFLALTLILLAGMTACNKADEKQNALNDQNKVVVDKFIQAIVTGNVAIMDSLMAENYMEYGPSRTDSATKTQVLENAKKAWAEQYAGMKYNRWVALAESVKFEEMENWVHEWGDVSITYKNGTPAVNFWIHGDFKVVDGKIRTYYAYYNVADILAQMGYTFEPPKAPKPDKKK
jgi:hypothetical protein